MRSPWVWLGTRRPRYDRGEDVDGERASVPGAGEPVSGRAVVAQGGQCGHQAWICADLEAGTHVGIGGRAPGDLRGGVVNLDEQRHADKDP